MKRSVIFLLLVLLVGLIGFSLHLAGTRIYQVDECQNIYMARLLATDRAKMSNVGSDFFQFCPLYFLARGATRSIDLFCSARFVMVEIFWLNLVLMVVAAGERLFSKRGLITLAGAATLAPLWDYGFEIRHDNLLLTGLLLMWCVVRIRPEGLKSYVIAGALAVLLQFIAFKAFVYTAPFALAILAFPLPGCAAPRWKLALTWVAGGAGMFLLIRGAYGVAGLWDSYTWGLRSLSSDLAGAAHFGPWKALGRLVTQTPLLLALLISALVAMAVETKRRRKAILNWEGNLPEVLLFLVAFGALLINPVPYPYNLLNMVPFAFLVVCRHVPVLLEEIRLRPALVPVVAAIILFMHLVPFGVATQRHLKWSNSRQEGLMLRAEQLTDPARDPVYDGIGMVPTRMSIHSRWLLHSLNLSSFSRGSSSPLRDMLTAKPAAVVIPSYRTDWLPEEDRALIRERYVPLADDFWVLGKILAAGGGAFEVIHPGRYRISTLEESDIAGTYGEGILGLVPPEKEGKVAGTLDGVPISSQVVDLTVGIHRIEGASDCQPAVVWMGPKLDRIRKLGQNDHRLLFVNWY